MLTRISKHVSVVVPPSCSVWEYRSKAACALLCSELHLLSCGDPSRLMLLVVPQKQSLLAWTNQLTYMMTPHSGSRACRTGTPTG
jgi:hypothetical protein